MSRITVNIPEGESGDYVVAHYTKDSTDNFWQAYLTMKNENHDNYTVLLKEGCPMPIMQDSEAEYNEHQWLWDNAEGNILIGGLGLGLIHQPLIDNPDVTSVTVVELEQDVVDLVWADCPKDGTFSLVVDDFETWTPSNGSYWDVIWCDTWLVDNPLTLAEYKTAMTTKYGPYCNKISFWSS